jgi:hypothetical protein
VYLKQADEPTITSTFPKCAAKSICSIPGIGREVFVLRHYHRNALARDDSMEVVTTGPVGKPLGPDGSGFRVVIVRDTGVEHQYYDFGKVPNTSISSRPPRNADAKSGPAGDDRQKELHQTGF